MNKRRLLPAPLQRASLTLALVAIAASAHAQSAIDAARAHRSAHGAKILREFADLLSIPNVASDLPNIRRNAKWIQAAFALRNIELALLELDGVPPLIVGTLEVIGATRTLGLYVHYDGQPVDAAKWSSPPWQATMYTRAIESGGERRPMPTPGEAIDPEWRLYARAAGDDKAPLISILAALDALSAASIAPTTNILFMFEGEEEVGSPHLRQYFERYADQLQADVWLICDGPAHQSRRPQLVFGVRGVTSIELTVYGAERNLHSGHYGNWSPNPAMELAQLLASAKDTNGQVLIEGFYDSVEPLGQAELAALEATPDIDASLMEELGLARTEGNGTLKECMLRPSFNIRGFESARTGAMARNMIPNIAVASIDVRMVRGNDPKLMLDLVERHIRNQGWHIVRDEPDHATRLAHPKLIKVVRGHGYRAARTPIDTPALAPIIAAADAAAREATGQGVILTPTLGGSLPLYLFEDLLEASFVVVPIANHDDNQHAPNENIRIGNLWYGIDLMALLLTIEE